MIESDDNNYLVSFKNWLEESCDCFNLKSIDPKIIPWLESAYKNGFEKGYKKRQQHNYEEWNQK